MSDLFQGQILLFKGTSQYDVLRDFIDDLYQGFKVSGYRPVIIDFVDSTAVKQLEQALEQPVFFALGMNGVGMELKAGGSSLYDAYNFPYFAFLVDHPYYHYERLQIPVNNLIVSCVDQTHAAYLREYHSRTFSRVFVPHGGSINAERLSWSDRSYDLVFAGTYADPDDFRQQWLGFDKHLSELLDDTAESAMYDNTRPLMDVMQEKLADKGLGENPVYLRKLAGLLSAVDSYVRHRRRQELIAAVSRHNEIRLFGNGWERHPTAVKQGKAVVHPSISFQKVHSLVAQSKIVLSSLPYFIHGGHERIFTSMLGGAIALTDGNAYLNRHFKAGEEIATYDLREMDKLGGHIAHLLENSDDSARMAEAGRQAVLNGHTWTHRAQAIAEAVKFHYTFSPLQ